MPAEVPSFITCDHTTENNKTKNTPPARPFSLRTYAHSFATAYISGYTIGIAKSKQI